MTQSSSKTSCQEPLASHEAEDRLAGEERIKADYREAAGKYRRDDEIEVQTETHRRLGRQLKTLCTSFPEPIVVLDAGCGTGRYFHCLENVRSLTGLDISEEMLAAASHPVEEEEIKVEELKLICDSIHRIAFPAESFDFIYSLGMFGYGCPLTLEVCDRFHEWLKPGGRLFVSVVDFAGLPLRARLRRRVRALIYPLLPPKLKTRLDKRQQRAPFFGMTRRQLQEMLRRTQFEGFDVESQVCHSPLWSGCQLECTASKAPA